MRRLVFHPEGWDDFTYWLNNDRATTKRILRRITDEHRLVYLVTDKDVVILQARYHY